VVLAAAVASAADIFAVSAAAVAMNDSGGPAGQWLVLLMTVGVPLVALALAVQLRFAVQSQDMAFSQIVLPMLVLEVLVVAAAMADEYYWWTNVAAPPVAESPGVIASLVAAGTAGHAVYVSHPVASVH